MKPEHNGKCGVITFLVEGGRLRVKLDDSTQLDLKPENLTKLLSHDESSESQLQGKHVFRPKVRSLLGHGSHVGAESGFVFSPLVCSDSAAT